MSAAIYGFWYFIFLRIYSSFTFDRSISIVACLIFAIILSAAEIWQAVIFDKALNSARFAHQAKNMHSLNAQEKTAAKKKSYVATRNLWLSYFVTVVVSVFALVLICRGFSEAFFERELMNRSWKSNSLMGLDLNSLWILGTGILIMTAPNMVMIHLGIKAVEKGGDI